jgi:hypothetical protein
MSGSTPELNLATAVDSDDNADYLTINLANSLRTVDALFNNVTGHNHNGAHQGGVVAPPAGSITSGMIADGTIVAADIANATITNAKLATDTARLNLLTNGGFEVWQRGNGPFTLNGTWTADRWSMGVTGTDTLSISRDTANQDSNSGACAACTYVLGTGGGAQMAQSLTNILSNLNGVTMSLSMRVRTSTPNAVRIGLYSGGYIYSAYHTGSGAYQTLTVTVTCAGGIAPNPVVSFSASCTAYLDNAMLVVGSVPADYAPLHPADDLARCLRYYEIIGNSGAAMIVAGWAGAAGEAIGAPWRFLAQKAVVPTVTKSGTFSVVNCAQPTVASPGLDGAQIYSTATAIGHVQYLTAGGSYLVEANP